MAPRMAKRRDIDTVDVPPGLLDESGDRRLHVGGTVRKEGWTVLNALDGDHVDVVGDLRDLSMFESGSFDVVYGSHIFEHLGYANDLPRAVREVARILREGGRFFVSVPDLPTLCRLYLDPRFDAQGRFAVMRMMFGGQVNPFDFHYVGLSDEHLAALCFGAGFSEVYRVPSFGFFEDTSDFEFAGVPVSLNMVARR
jgi:predicted SAM-dependent methyltransferase